MRGHSEFIMYSLHCTMFVFHFPHARHHGLVKGILFSPNANFITYLNLISLFAENSCPELVECLGSFVCRS